MHLFTDVKKLRAFVAIAEEESITGAARRLNTSQPWLSDQLRQLEELMGVPLVERAKGKPSKLSPAGQEMLTIARKLLASCAEATDDMEELQTRVRGKLVLGVDPITLYIPERNKLITQFMAERSEIHLQIESRPPFELLSCLKSGEFDLILTGMPDEFPEFDILPLYRSELHLVIPKSHAQKYRHLMEGHLEGAKILTLSDSYHPATLPWIRQQFAAANLEPVECPEPSFHALVRYASILGLMTILPDFSSSVPELSKDMKIRKIKNWSVFVNWSLVRRRDSYKKVTSAFWNYAAQSLPAATL